MTLTWKIAVYCFIIPILNNPSLVLSLTTGILSSIHMGAIPRSTKLDTGVTDQMFACLKALGQSECQNQQMWSYVQCNTESMPITHELWMIIFYVGMHFSKFILSILSACVVWGCDTPLFHWDKTKLKRLNDISQKFI